MTEILEAYATLPEPRPLPPMLTPELADAYAVLERAAEHMLHDDRNTIHESLWRWQYLRDALAAVRAAREAT